MLNINRNISEKRAELALEGRLDTVTAPQLEEELQGVMPAIIELVLDFKNLEYISSAGLRVLLSAQKIMTKKGEMKLTNVCEEIMEIFEVTGFSDIFTIV